MMADRGPRFQLPGQFDFKKKWLSKRGCYGNVNVGAHDKTTLKCSQIIFRTFTRGGRVQKPSRSKKG